MITPEQLVLHFVFFWWRYKEGLKKIQDVMFAVFTCAVSSSLHPVMKRRELLCFLSSQVCQTTIYSPVIFLCYKSSPMLTCRLENRESGISSLTLLKPMNLCLRRTNTGIIKKRTPCSCHSTKNWTPNKILTGTFPLPPCGLDVSSVYRTIDGT
jgi:hypothetical protein